MKKTLFESILGAVIPFVMIPFFDTRFPLFVSVPIFAVGLFLSVRAFRKSWRIIKEDEKAGRENPTVQLCAIIAGSSFVAYIFFALPMMVFSVIMQSTPF